ncbi:MAG TPA: hypothetical protein VJO53_11825 [Candidatus Acidoferrales bacterium]|nr:hypothetical protein [Candidatus Acidoferrales bacterium]
MRRTSRYYFLSFVFVAAASGLLTAATRAQNRPAPTGRTIELPQDDLFSYKGWTSSQVSVLGFRLGMTRAEAFSHANDQKLTFENVDAAHDTACSTASLCDLYSQGKPYRLYRGIEIHFSKDNRVEGIAIEVTPVGADTVVRRNRLSRSFVGGTYQFFEHYSDSLRLRLLGPESTKHFDQEPGMEWSRTTYQYPRLGLIVDCDYYKESPGSLFDLTVTLVPPN